MTDHDQDSHDHSPKHLLETGLLGRPKGGKQRVSDLATKQDEVTGAESPPEGPDNATDEEQRI